MVSGTDYAQLYNEAYVELSASSYEYLSLFLLIIFVVNLTSSFFP